MSPLNLYRGLKYPVYLTYISRRERRKKEIAEQYLRKGSKVYIEGQLETRKWQDQSGQDRYTTEIVLRPFRGELTLLDGASGEDRQSRDTSDGYGSGSYGGGYGSNADLDDDLDSIPF